MGQNPFSTTFGIAPESSIDRSVEANLLKSAFPLKEKAYIITGPRGVGKTAFLTKLSNEFKEEGYLVIDLNPFSPMEEQLAARLYDEGKLKKLFLQGEFSFSFHGLTFSLKGKEDISDVSTLLSRMFAYLKKKGQSVIVTIDDVSPTAYLKNFIFSFQQFIRGDYPIGLLMTGLYENVSELSRDKGLTFLLRCEKLFLQPLNLSSIALSYKKYLKTDEKEAARLSKLSKGYAYGYQLLGSIVYEKGLNEESLEEYDKKLSENAYSLMWEKLSKKEKEILYALGEGQDQPSIAKSLHLSNGAIQVYKKRLFEKGVLDVSKRGEMDFALPRFKEFVRWQKLFEE